MDFGEIFAKLSTRPEKNKPAARKKLLAQAPRSGGGGGGGGGGKYAIMREAMGRDGAQLRAILESFGPP